MEGNIPGTLLPRSDSGGTFSVFIPLIKATDGLTLGQVCAITGLESSTVQNWVKRGFVARPVAKKYRERQLARILLICSLKDSMKIDSIGEIMRLVNGSANDESDDILPEDKMYDYFCEVARKTENFAGTQEKLDLIIKDILKDFSPGNPSARQRLNDALSVMALAYISAKYKKEAEKRFFEMKGGVRK